MAASSLLTLLDDIASTLDDVATMTKVATKKTAGVLGDDLALNAQQMTGLNADRELPLVWSVAKGSAVNKLILVPLAVGISQFVPWLVTPLLMAGGLFLCFEGFEKIYEKFFHKDHEEKVEKPTNPVAPLPEDYEKERVKGAVRTDFILSAEIIVISLGTVAQAPLLQQFSVLIGISVIMTIGVYGLVAIIVKLDDLGIYLSAEKNSPAVRKLGRGILAFAPLLMRFLGIAGTIAMFLVGGGILVHGIPFLHHIEESHGALAGGALSLVTGLVAGGFVVLLLGLVKKFRKV